MRHQILSAIFAATALISLPAMAQEESLDHTITLQGVGEVAGAPDMATLTSGVISQADTARDALTQNNAAVNKLMNLMRDMGIEDRDLQTTNFSIQPLYERNNENNNTRRDPKVIGYQVSNSITVRVRDLDQVGAVLDQAVTVGANSIDGITFSVSEPDEMYNDARRAAVEDAMQKAELYADAAGVTLGDITRITEADYGRPQQENFAMARMASDSAVPVASGELTFSSRVSIVWEISAD